MGRVANSVKAQWHIVGDVEDTSHSIEDEIYHAFDEEADEEILQRRYQFYLQECLRQCPESTRNAIEQMLKTKRLWTDKDLIRKAGVARSTFYRNLYGAKQRANKVLNEMVARGEI